MKKTTTCQCRICGRTYEREGTILSCPLYNALGQPMTPCGDHSREEIRASYEALTMRGAI